MELVSIIVPVYNVEEYLIQCLDSVLRQTYTALEIILIDDGSTDESGNICEQYQQKDPRIIAIHQKNGGPASARNAGLDECHGEYIAFVDSDDWLEPDFIEVLVQNIDESDFVVCGYYQVTAAGTIPVCLSENVSIKIRDFVRMHIDDEVKGCNRLSIDAYIGAYFWNKLFRRSLLLSIRFPEGRIYEDQIMFSQYLQQVKLVNIVTYCGYYYRIRSTSIMHSNRIDAHIFDLIYARQEQQRLMCILEPAVQGATYFLIIMAHLSCLRPIAIHGRVEDTLARTALQSLHGYVHQHIFELLRYGTIRTIIKVLLIYIMPSIYFSLVKWKYSIHEKGAASCGQ